VVELWLKKLFLFRAVRDNDSDAKLRKRAAVFFEATSDRTILLESRLISSLMRCDDLVFTICEVGSRAALDVHEECEEDIVSMSPNLRAVRANDSENSMQCVLSCC